MCAWWRGGPTTSDTHASSPPCRDSAGVARLAARRERLTPEAWLAALRGIHLVPLGENRALLGARDGALLEELRRLLTRHGATDDGARRLLEPAIVESVAGR